MRPLGGALLCQMLSQITVKPRILGLGRVDIHRIAIADPTRWIIAL
jgi:hypothetical protein